MKQQLLNEAKAMQEELVSWRRQLHQHPEIGFELPETTAFVEAKLKEFGYMPQRVGKAGIVALCGKAGKTILLRADMDALPLCEESGLPFASTNNYAHACGHDIHTTALLGAAKLLKQYEGLLHGGVQLMFQPCEEGMGGAQDMLDNGLLDNSKPEAALALHVVHEKTGTAGIRPGYAGASCDVFEIVIKGIGCHGAAANLGIDPINAAAHLITALQALSSREVAPDEMLVVTVCSVHGGDTHNIIPEQCRLSGTIRTAKDTVRKFARRRLEEIAKGVAATFRAQCDVVFKSGVPPMVNDLALSESMAVWVDQLLGQGTAWEIPAMTGSEDFSLIGERIPSVLLWFGTGNEPEGYAYGVHHPKVTFNEDAISQMSAVYAYLAYSWLASHC